MSGPLWSVGPLRARVLPSGRFGGSALRLVAATVASLVPLTGWTAVAPGAPSAPHADRVIGAVAVHRVDVAVVASGSAGAASVPAPSPSSSPTPVPGAVPDTVLGSSPAQGSVQTSGTLTLHAATVAPATAGTWFQCRLDAGAWRPCSSAPTFGGLAVGPHTAQVRAVDSLAGADPTPASRTITVVPASPGLVEPGAGTTGVPAGTTLTRYDGNLVITTPGAVYDALDIHGFVTVKAPDVTIRRSIIRGGVATGNLGLVTNTTPTATGFVLEDSELVPEHPSVWLDGMKGSNFTLRRVEVHGTVDSVKVYGNDVRVESSWLHGNVMYASDPNQGGGPTHNDGVQVLGGRRIALLGNRIEDADNAALMVTQDYSATTELVFDANWAHGGGCTVNLAHKKLASMRGITVTRNRFGHDTRVPDCPVLASKMTTMLAAGNVYNDSGLPARIRNNG